jgi:hypothetical protein
MSEGREGKGRPARKNRALPVGREPHIIRHAELGGAPTARVRGERWQEERGGRAQQRECECECEEEE